MAMFAALDGSQEETAICVVSEDGTQVAEANLPTCPHAFAKMIG